MDELAGFFDVQNFSAFIVPALGTRTVRHFFLVAIRTFRQRVPLQRVVGATVAGARFRMSTFRVCHGILFSLWARSTEPSRISLFQLFPDIFEGYPARILFHRRARTLSFVQVLSAMGA